MMKKMKTGFRRQACRFLSVLLALLLLLGVSLTQPARADAVIDTVSVASLPLGIGMNTVTNRIYVTSGNYPSKMTVIDGTDYTVITAFDIGGYPQGVAVDETDNKIYVTDTSNNEVLVIDSNTNTITTTFNMDGMPGGIVWDSVNNLFYVTIWETSEVAVIDGETDSILEYVDVGSDDEYNYPKAIAVNAATNKIYVTHNNGTVSVIDGSSKTVVKTLSVNSYPQEIAVNTATNKIYVIHANTNKVTVISGETDSIISIIETGQDLIALTVNPSTNKIYVGDQADGCVYVIDGTTDTVLQPIDFQNTFTPSAAVADKTRNKIYITSLDADDVKIIDGSGIDSVSVTGLTAPMQGELPGTASALMAGDDTYTVTGLTWQNYDGSAATLDGEGKIQSTGSLYRAFIELTAQPAYKFSPTVSYAPAVNTGSPSSGTVVGGDVLGNKLTFTVTFEVNITSMGVIGLIGPQTGELPLPLSALTSRHPAMYSVTGLTWLNYGGTAATLDGSGRFVSGGQTYLARVELTSMPGYKFSSGDFFPTLGGGMRKLSTYSDGRSVTGNKVYFTVFFPADITTANVSGLAAPVAGAAPVNGGLTSTLSVTGVDFDTPASITSYSFSYNVYRLTWQNGDGTPATLTGGKFNPNSNYKAVIKLWSDNAGYLCKFPVGGLTATVNVGTLSAGVTDGGYVAGNTLTFEVTFPATGALAPAMTGPTAMSLTEGYTATSTGTYDITGTAPVTVTKTTGDSKITWNDTTKKLDVEAGLLAGSYPVTLKAANGTAPDATLNFTLTVDAAIYGISTSESGAYTFAEQTAGYSPVAAHAVTVTNTGNQATGVLAVALSGTNADSFMLSKSSIASIVASGSDSFTVKPKDGLAAGTYTSAVTISGSNMTPAALTVTQVVRAASGGGDSSGGGSAPDSPQTYTAKVNAGDGSNVSLPVTVDNGSANVSVDAGTGNILMSDGNTTVITVPAIPDVDTYALGIPVQSLSTQNEQGGLAFSTDTGTVTIPPNMLTGVAGISGSRAEISIGQGDKTSLPEAVKAAIGGKPLISLSLSIDGSHIDWSNPNAPVTVSIPYTPTAEELADSESIVIWYLDSSGNAVSVPNGHYDPAAGTVTFTVTHFSLYAIAYNKMSFNDVASNAWYGKAVSFIAARGITTGTGNENYSPEAKLTRGEFIVLMMRAYGIAPEANSTDNFADAGNTYYTGYLAAAKRLGISAGVGNNRFMPGKEISRQEMFTLLYNALKVIGKLPQGNSGKTLSDFTDAGQIDTWAKDAMLLLVESGTVGGSNNKLTPTGTTTRAEMAQVLYYLRDK